MTFSNLDIIFYVIFNILKYFINYKSNLGITNFKIKTVNQRAVIIYLY